MHPGFSKKSKSDQGFRNALAVIKVVILSQYKPSMVQDDGTKPVM